MLFQTLDDKKHCAGIYCNGEIIYDNLPDNLTRTWSYAGFLEDLDIEYANLYVAGKQLGDLYPPELEEDWKKISKRVKSIIKSFQAVGADISQIDIKQVIPQKFIVQYLFYKNLRRSISLSS